MTHWTAGQTLQNGKYKIEQMIGSGGFGITYRAKDQRTGKILAIKTLNHVIQQKPNFDKLHEDFVKEAFRLVQCRHPNIVQVYDVFQENGLWCMVMEYIDGINLYEYQQDRGVLSQHEALRIIRQMGEALTFVHDCGFLHRDVKPANILLRRPSLDAVLIDFGLAREFTEGQKMTHTNSLTQCFAPIEQYKLKAERGAYTDVYALAATLYYLRTGKEPFPANFMKEAKILLLPPKQHNPQIEDWENEAILEGMKLEAKDRPQTIHAWLELLKEDKVDRTFKKSIVYWQLQFYLKTGKWLHDSIEAKNKLSLDKVIDYRQLQNYFQDRKWLHFLKEEKDDLISEKGVDYRQLRDYLKAGKWKEADLETRQVILKAVNREEEGWLNTESIENFPCIDLRTIDQLWVKYSNGRFGFSVQKRFWQQAGGKIDYETECRLGDLVGWRVNDEWKAYDELTFSQKAPEGHLPVCGEWRDPWLPWGVGGVFVAVGRSLLCRRVGG